MPQPVSASSGRWILVALALLGFSLVCFWASGVWQPPPRPPALANIAATPTVGVAAVQPDTQRNPAKHLQRGFGGLVLHRFDHKPVPDAQVELVASTIPQPALLDAWSSAPVESVRSDEAGRFSFKTRSGLFRLRASAAGFPMLLGPVLRIEPGRNLQHRVPLRPEGELEVVVLGPGDQPVEAAELELGADFEGWSSRQTAVSDAEGQHRFLAPVGAGFSLLVRAAGFLEIRLAGLKVDDGKLRRIVVSLKPGVELQGEVVDPQGQRLAGATVDVLSVFQDDRGPKLQVVTDAQGRFSLFLPSGSFRLWARHPGSVTELVQARTGGEPLRIVLRPAVILLGQVVQRASRQPIAGARIQASGAEVFSDAQGQFQLPTTRDSGSLEILASAPGFAQQRRRIQELAAQSTRAFLEFELDPAVFLRGIVLDAFTQLPIAGALVGFEAADPQTTGRSGQFDAFLEPQLTGASGNFELSVPAPTSHVLVQAEGYTEPRLSLNLSMERDTEDLEIRLRPAGRIEGRVVQSRGQPVADAAVQAFTSPYRSVMETRSDADGRFQFEPLPADLQYSGIRALHPDFAPGVSDAIFVPAGGEARNVEIVLRPASTIAGMVLDFEGKPAAGISVQWTLRLQKSDHKDLHFRTLNSGTESDAEGHFSLGPLVAGTYELQCKENRNARWDSKFCREVVQLPEGKAIENVRLKMPKWGSISGTVRDPAGKPLAEKRVQLRHLDPGGGVPDSGTIYLRDTAEAMTEADGSYRFGSLTGRKYRLIVVGTSGALSDPREASPPAQDVDFVVRHAEGGTIRGLVEAEGRPLDEFEISHSRDVRRSFSKAEGRFEFSGLDAGTYQFQVKAAGFSPATSESIRLEAGKTVEGVRIELKAAGSIAGIVLDRKGVPLAGVAIEAGLASEQRQHDTFSAHLVRKMMDSGFKTAARTSNTGEFFVDQVPQGLVLVQATHPDYQSVRVQIRLEAGQQRQGLEIRMDALHTIRGSVLSEPDRRPVAGAFVALDVSPRIAASVRGRQQSVLTQNDGTFELKGVSPGEHLVSAVSSDSKSSILRSLEVQGDLDGVELVLETLLRLHGKVLDQQGNPVVDCRISLSGSSGDYQVQTDPQGRFEILNLPPGKYTVYAKVPLGNGYGFLSRTVNLVGDPTPEVVLQPASKQGLSGTIRRASGGPVDRFRIVLETASRQPHRPWSFVAEQSPAASGAYRFPHLAPGAYRIKIRGAQPYQGQGLPVFEKLFNMAETDVQVDITVPDGVLLRGRVVQEDGSPLARANLELRPETASRDEQPGSTGTDPSGNYAFQDLQPGRYTLQASLQDWSSERVTLDLKPGPAVQQDFTLRHKAALRVRTRNPSGRIPVDTRLFIFHDNGLFERAAPLFPDEQGWAEVHGLAEGDYWLLAKAPNLASATTSQPVSLGASGTVPVDLVLGNAGRLRLSVRDKTGAAVQNAAMHLSRKLGSVELDLRPLLLWESLSSAWFTDSRGGFEAFALEPGSYRIQLLDPHPASIDVQIHPNQTTEAQLQLPD